MSDRWQRPESSGPGSDRPRGFDHRTTPRRPSDGGDDDREDGALDALPAALRPWALRRRSAGRPAPDSAEAPTTDPPPAADPPPTGGSAPPSGPVVPPEPSVDREEDRDTTPEDPAPGAAVSAVPDVDARELVAAALSKVTRHSVIVLDRELRVRAAAGHGHEAPPYDEASMRGRPLRDAIDQEQWAVYGPLLATAVDGATSRRFITSRLGVGRAEVTCGPVVAGGAITGAIMVVRELEVAPAVPADVPGAAALAEAGRAEIASVFDLTFEHSPIAQALLAPDGRWVRANRATCRMLGVREADLVGRPIREILAADARDAARDRTDRLRSGELDEFALPTRFRTTTGGTVDGNIRLAAARDPAGELQGFVAQLIDLAD